MYFSLLKTQYPRLLLEEYVQERQPNLAYLVAKASERVDNKAVKKLGAVGDETWEQEDFVSAMGVTD